MPWGQLAQLVFSGLYIFFRGVLDAVQLQRCFRYFARSETIRLRTLQCFVLNGCIFLGSIVLYNVVVLPTLQKGASYTSIRVQEKFGIWLASSTLLSPSSVDATGNTASHHAASTANPQFWDILFGWFYRVLWIYPVYSLSFILNTFWYQDIAEQALILSSRDLANKASTLTSPSSSSINPTPAITASSPPPTTPLERVIDELFRLIINSIWLLQTYAVLRIPFIGVLAYRLHWAWLASLYCFEYRWVYYRWSAERRLTFFESHWLYFAGFGFPVTALYLSAPQFVDAGIFALIFPICILLAIQAEPLPFAPLVRVPLFYVVELLTWGLLKGLSRSHQSSKRATTVRDRNTNSHNKRW